MVDRRDRRQRDDEAADEDDVRDRADADLRAERPGDSDDDEPDADVRRAERERRVLGDPLVKDVPGREPELRLELEHDREGEEEQADEERGQSGGEPTANAWRRVHAPTIGSDPAGV